MIARIPGLEDVVFRLVFSPDGRYLAATLCGPDGVRVFDRDKDWSEVFHDSTYAAIPMARLSPETGISRRRRMMGKSGYMTTTFGSSALRFRCRTDIDLECRIQSNSRVLAVGYDDVAAVDLFDSRSLSQLPGPDLDGLALGTLEQVAWSSDGQTLYASGDYPNSGDVSILSWDGAGRGKRLSRLACRDNADTALSIVTLPEQKLLVTTANPCLTLFDGDDHIV